MTAVGHLANILPLVRSEYACVERSCCSAGEAAVTCAVSKFQSAVGKVYWFNGLTRHWLLCLCKGGAYAVLVRRQLSGPKLESSTSLAAIGEEAEDVQNGDFDDNADLMNRTETGEPPWSP